MTFARQSRFPTALMISALLVLVAGPALAQQPTQELYFDKPQALSKSEKALLRGDAKTARSLLSRALDRGLGKSHRYTAHNNLCVAHHMLEEFELAVEHCRKAIEIRSNRWRAYNNLGNALAELGQFDAAVEAYRQGLELNAKNKTLQNNLELVIRRKRILEPRSRLKTPLSIG